MADLAALPFRPVRIATDQPGRVRAVGSVREAAECLVAGWPEKGRGEAYRAALQATYNAIGETLAPEVARLAFIAAAKEAGIFVREGDGRR